MTDRFPVEWKGMALSLGLWTVALKQKYCDWLYDYLTDQACRRLAGRTAALTAYLDNLFADKPWWGAGKLSHHVETAWQGQDGGVMYVKLLLGDSAKPLSDADIQQFIDDKEEEQKEADRKLAEQGQPPPYPPANDYTRAMRKILEHEFPKAELGPVFGPAPTGGTNTTGS